MDNKGLLFIPDISGFTNFVTDPEIEAQGATHKARLLILAPVLRI